MSPETPDKNPNLRNPLGLIRNLLRRFAQGGNTPTNPNDPVELRAWKRRTIPKSIPQSSQLPIPSTQTPTEIEFRNKYYNQLSLITDRVITSAGKKFYGQREGIYESARGKVSFQNSPSEEGITITISKEGVRRRLLIPKNERMSIESGNITLDITESIKDKETLYRRYFEMGTDSFLTFAGEAAPQIDETGFNRIITPDPKYASEEDMYVGYSDPKLVTEFRACQSNYASFADDLDLIFS